MKNKELNAFQLKILMTGFMVLDHLSLVPNLLSTQTTSVIHALTRVVGVWFAYVAVEGFLYTRDRLRYNGRLFLWAGIMASGNYLLNFVLQNKQLVVSNNIFLTLAVGVFSLNAFFGFKKDETSSRKGLKKASLMIMGLIALAIGVIATEGGVVILPFMILTYLFRERVLFRDVSYVVVAFILFLVSFNVYPTIDETVLMLLYNSDWLFVLIIPILHIYNGERGLNTPFSKYFFYIFYPMHIWLLALIGFAVS